MNRKTKPIFLLLIIIILTVTPFIHSLSAEEINDLTIEEELSNIQNKLIGIEKSIADLNLGMKKLKENLTIFLIKRDKSFDITYMEFLVNDRTWYKHLFDAEDNASIENAAIGKKMAKLFWGGAKKKRTKLTIRCFYRDADDPNKRENKLIKRFFIQSKTKISNFLSIELTRNKNPKNKEVINIKLDFW